MSEIRPSADLRNKYKEISNICKEQKKPVYITVNGRGDTVLLDIKEYERMKEQIKTYQVLLEAEEQIERVEGKLASEVITRLKRKYGE